MVNKPEVDTANHLSQHDEPTRNTLDPVYRSEHFPKLLIPRSLRYEGGFENGEGRIRGGGRRIINHLKERRYQLFALIPLLAAMLESSILVYFFVIYISLPSDPITGSLPRISDVYSTWPFISCVGSLRLAVYRAFAFAVASLYESSSLIGLYLDRNNKVGYWFRRIGALAGLTSTVLLIWLVFASENVETHTHLYIAGVKILATLAAQGSILMCDYRDRKVEPILNTVPAAIMLMRWKAIILALSIPLATAAEIGFFICNDPAKTQTPSAACFKIMAVGAPAEWMISILSVSYMLNMAYGFYANDRIAAAVNAAYNTESSPMDSLKATECHGRGWNTRAEDFDVDEAPFFRDAKCPGKAWPSLSDADDLHFDSTSLSRVASVRGFV